MAYPEIMGAACGEIEKVTAMYLVFTRAGLFLGLVVRRAGNIPSITSLTWTWGCLLALIGWQLGVAGGSFKLVGFWLA